MNLFNFLLNRGCPALTIPKVMAAALLGLSLAYTAPLAAQVPGTTVDEMLSAIVKIRTKALPNARTTQTLGAGREGSGVVIDSNGLILTIGYLILEAEAIEVVGSDGKTIAATQVGYDHSTGFGLVRAITPLAGKPMELGDSSKLAERENVMVAGHGGREGASIAYVVSRREFTGYWEYLLEDAIFTAPMVYNWGGAALIGGNGRLLGIGSLLVRDAIAPGTPFPGNMFVPINLLKPILGDLLATGRASSPARPWLGVNTEEVQGRLFITRVSPESPADNAGLRVGDILVGVGGAPIANQADFYRKLWARGGAGIEVPLQVLQGVKVQEVKVRSTDRLNYLRAKPTY